MNENMAQNQNNYIQEDEIDLRELWNTIWSNKWKIIIFSFIVTVATIFYALKLPNIYKSETLLAPSDQDAGANLGGLSALAGLAGVSIGGGGKIPVINKMGTLKDNYIFNENIIKKHNLLPILIKDFDKLDKEQKEMAMFDGYKALTNIVTIADDKKSGLISLKVEHEDREFAYKLVNIYLDELSETIRKQELQNIDEKIGYYNQEIERATDASLKEQLSKLASALIQNKVLAKASKYYGMEQITKPFVVT
ncbi:MAG: hypothetical protein QG567_650, partial [Campylobacterota bacterium]|nr:hypothetical protein [Campylobacterota bacterium]